MTVLGLIKALFRRRRTPPPLRIVFEIDGRTYLNITTEEARLCAAYNGGILGYQFVLGGSTVTLYLRAE